jgi:hypothetical protein
MFVKKGKLGPFYEVPTVVKWGMSDGRWRAGNVRFVNENDKLHKIVCKR